MADCRRSGDSFERRLHNVQRPSRLERLVWMFDSKNLPAVGTWAFVHTNLHNGGAHFLFLDFHVAGFRNVNYWDFTAGQGRTNHPAIQWIP